MNYRFWRTIFDSHNVILTSSLFIETSQKILSWMYKVTPRESWGIDGARTFAHHYICVDANDIVVIFSALKSFFNANRFSNEFLRRHLLVSSRVPLSSHDQVYLSQDALFTHTFLCRKPEEQADLSVSEGKLPKETTELRVWYQPIETIHYALLESIHLINHYFRTLISHRKTFVFFVLLFLSFLVDRTC